MLARAIRLIAVFAAAASLGIMGYAGDFSSIWIILPFFGFAAWVSGPYAVVWLAAGKLRSDVVASGVLALGLVGGAGLGVYAYAATFLFNSSPDAQDGLIYLFVPLYQHGAMLLIYAVAFTVRRLRRV